LKRAKGYRNPLWLNRGYAAVGLVRAKTPANVGAVLRAAHCFGAQLVVLDRLRCPWGNLPTNVHKTERHTPVIRTREFWESMPHDCVPVGVDLVPGAVPLWEFKHPPRAMYIFGPEDGTLGKEHLSRCATTVYVPTEGCMNLAAAVNVVLYDRMRQRWNSLPL